MAAALGLPLAVCAALHPLRDSVSDANTVLLLVLVVVAVAATGRRTAGVVAALSSAVWFDFFLTAPYLRFAIADRDDVETAVLLTAVGLAVTELALWGQRQQASASGRAGYLDGLVSAAAMAADADVSSSALTGVVSLQLVDVLGVEECRFRAGGPSGRPRLLDDGSVVHDGAELDVDRTGLPTWDVVELPVRSGRRAAGTFVLTSAARTARPTLEQRLVAVALAEQVGAAFLRPTPAS